MRLASGIAPVKKYLAAGVKVGLGVDGSASNDASNMLLEARQALLLARLRLGLLPPEGPRRFFLLSQSDPLREQEWMTAREALEIATRGGAAVLGRDDIGSLETGQVRRLLQHQPAHRGLCGSPERSGCRHAVLCAAEGTLHGDQRTSHRGGRRVVTVDMGPVIEAHNRFSLSAIVSRGVRTLAAQTAQIVS